MTLPELLQLAGGLLGLAMYVPLVMDILRRRGQGHSLAMWGLWAVLDSIATATLVIQQGNYFLTAGFAIGSIVLSALLLRYGKCKWGRLEWVVLGLVILCLVLWAAAGSRAATIATTLAIIAAGVPGLVETWRHPDPFAARIWAGFAAANIISLIGGESWSVEERFAPAAFVLQTLTMLFAANRRQANLLPATPSKRTPRES